VSAIRFCDYLELDVAKGEGDNVLCAPCLEPNHTRLLGQLEVLC
jgi:hypothetical protein